MYDTCTILNSNIVTEDNTECLSRSLSPVAILVCLNGLNPWEELLVAHALELCTLPLAYYLKWDELVARLILLKGDALGFLVED